MYKKISFANEAFCKIDQNNGGFLEGRRTADNLFVINGLAQRQILLNRNLILCFVDFSKSFDMVNRSVLFYTIMKCGWYGKVIDTLRSLYTKTKFRVKHQGWLSHLIDNVMGVNQGGIASGFLFLNICLIWERSWTPNVVYVSGRKSLPIYSGPTT